MSTAIPLTDSNYAGIVGSAWKRGPCLYRSSSGRFTILGTFTGSQAVRYCRIFTALPTDSSVSFVTTLDCGQSGVDGRLQAWRAVQDGDSCHIHIFRYYYDYTDETGPTADTDRDWSWRRVDLSNGTLTADTHTYTANDTTDGLINNCTLFSLPDGNGVAVVHGETQALRVMGTDHQAWVNNVAHSSGSYSWSEHTEAHAETLSLSYACYPEDSDYWGLNVQNAFDAYHMTISTDTGELLTSATGTEPTGTLFAYSHTNLLSHTTFYDSTLGEGYFLASNDAGSIAEFRTKADYPNTPYTTITYSMPAGVSSANPVAYYYDEANGRALLAWQDSGTIYMSERTDFVSGYSTAEVIYVHDTLPTYSQNNPICIYESGGAFYVAVVVGTSGDAELVFDIPMVAVGENDLSVTIAKTYSTKSIAAQLDLDGFTFAVSLSQAVSRSLSASLINPSLDLRHGFEARYQTAEAGQLLQRNVYRAYVGATEFPLYSVSANFSGLDAYTGDVTGSSAITLKAPISQQAFLTSQIGQEFIVLNGIEIGGVFQGVEFVRGLIDSVRASGNLVTVTSLATEEFSVGVVTTISTGVEFVSSQRIRFGQINPALRPGARVITPHGTYDVASLVFFVGPNQKFMELGAYG